MTNVTESPPAISPEPGCIEVILPMQIGSGRSIASGVGTAAQIRIRIFKCVADGHLVGRAWFGDGANGPPLHVHGGAAAYVLDEAMGAVGWMNDYPVVAAKLEFEYLQMSPLKVDLHIEAKITSATDRRVFIACELKTPDGVSCVRGKGEFAILSQKKIGALGAEKFDPQGLLKNPNLKWAPDDAR